MTRVIRAGFILSRVTFPGAPSYGGVRTWVEGSQTRGDRALAEASNLLGYDCLTQAVAKRSYRLYPYLEQ